jgi:hypothetical protein
VLAPERRGGPLEDVVDEGGSAAVGELVGAAVGRQPVRGAELVGAEHVLDALGEGLPAAACRILRRRREELEEVVDVVREVGDGSVVEVVARPWRW